MQAQPPEVTGTGGVVTVLGLSGQPGALDRLTRASAFGRGGVHQPHDIAGRGSDQLGHRVHQRPQLFVMAGLLGLVGEQVTQVGVGVHDQPSSTASGSNAEPRAPSAHEAKTPPLGIIHLVRAPASVRGNDHPVHVT